MNVNPLVQPVCFRPRRQRSVKPKGLALGDMSVIAISNLRISGRKTGRNLRTPTFLAFTEPYEALLTNAQEVASPRVHQLNPRKYGLKRRRLPA
jgi:hypothetical protein